jgi:hypothetical protein
MDGTLEKTEIACLTEIQNASPVQVESDMFMSC